MFMNSIEPFEICCYGTYLFFNYLFRTHGFRRLKIHDKGSGSPVCFVEYQVHSLLAFFLLHRCQPVSQLNETLLDIFVCALYSVATI